MLSNIYYSNDMCYVRVMNVYTVSRLLQSNHVLTTLLLNTMFVIIRSNIDVYNVVNKKIISKILKIHKNVDYVMCDNTYY